MKPAIVRWIPILLAVIGIFALTLQNTPDNVAMSEDFRRLLCAICTKAGWDVNGMWWNTPGGIRHLGHVIEYFILSAVAAVAFRRSLGTVAFCMLISLLDQAMKILIPMRHFEMGDLPYDAVGICAGVTLVWLIGMCVRGNKGRKNI